MGLMKFCHDVKDYFDLKGFNWNVGLTVKKLKRTMYVLSDLIYARND